MSTVKINTIPSEKGSLERLPKSNLKSDWKLKPNVEVRIELEKLENQDEKLRKNFQKYFSRNPLNALKKNSGTIESTNPTNSDPLHKELHEIILKCEPDCSFCRKYIYDLSAHIRDVHTVAHAQVQTYEMIPLNTNTTPIPISIVQPAMKLPSGNPEPDNYVPLDNVWVMPENIGDTDEVDPLNTDNFSGVPSDEDLIYPFDQTKIKKNDASEMRKPYIICEYCDTSFSTMSNLSDHKLWVHNGEKPAPRILKRQHKCKICGEFFLGLSKLITHTKMHSVEKRVKCDTCGIRFHRPDDLNAHIRRVHNSGKKSKKCEFCGTSFNRKDSLNNHIRTHHQTTGPTEKDKLYISPLNKIIEDLSEFETDNGQGQGTVQVVENLLTSTSLDLGDQLEFEMLDTELDCDFNETEFTGYDIDIKFENPR